MIQSDSKFNAYQLIVVLIATMLGVEIIQLPSGLTGAVGNESWIVVIAGGAIMLISIILMCKAGSVYDGEGLVGASKNILGRRIGVVLVIPIIICIFIANIIEARIFTGVIRMFLLPKTPDYGVLMPFLILIMILARGDIKYIVRFVQFVIPFLLIIAVGLCILTIQNADFTNLLPVMQRSPIEYVKGIQGSIFSYLGVSILIIFYPYLQKKDFKSAFKASAIALGIIVFLYTSIVILCITKLGVGETKWLLHPTIALIKTAYIPGGFLERLEGLLMGVWVLFIFTTMTMTLQGISIIVADMFELKNHKHVVTIIIALVYMSSPGVTSILNMYDLGGINSLVFGLYTLFVFPALLYGVYRFKNRKRGDSSEK